MPDNDQKDPYRAGYDPSAEVERATAKKLADALEPTPQDPMTARRRWAITIGYLAASVALATVAAYLFGAAWFGAVIAVTIGGIIVYGLRGLGNGLTGEPSRSPWRSRFKP